MQKTAFSNLYAAWRTLVWLTKTLFVAFGAFAGAVLWMAVLEKYEAPLGIGPALLLVWAGALVVFCAPATVYGLVKTVMTMLGKEHFDD